jgi:hypothetical protein
VLEFHFEPIVFGGGVPVGGAAHLTLGQNGSYHFRGHFHDSGAVGFDVALFWAVKDFQDRAYTFENAGSVGGTFTAGSRDHDFDVNSFDARIADNWANIGALPTAHAQAKVDIDLGALRASVMEVVGAVQEVAAIVAYGTVTGGQWKGVHLLPALPSPRLRIAYSIDRHGCQAPLSLRSTARQCGGQHEIVMVRLTPVLEGDVGGLRVLFAAEVLQLLLQHAPKL